jgi:hypothetical protein
MVEFIVGATFFLVPLYLAIQAMGKFSDVRHVTDSAARYAVWERTVWFDETSSRFYTHNRPNQKTDASIKNEIATRILSDRNGPLAYKLADKSATTFTNGLDPLWEDAVGEPYLREFNQLTSTDSHSKPSRDFLGDAISLINNISIPKITGTLAPPVPSDTLATAQVSFAGVAKDSPVYKRLWSKAEGLPDDWVGLDFNGQGGILSNTWSANSRDGTKSMVAESVPSSPTLGLGVALNVIKAPLLLWDPIAVNKLDVGKINVDVVPADRLK